MANVYVARRRLRVDGRDVMPGEDVPEANGWRNLPTYVHNGSLSLVQTDVVYARGMNQRRPLDPDRADYRVQRDRWHGEVQHGGGAPVSQQATVTSISPADTIAVGAMLTVTGTGFSGTVSVSLWNSDFSKGGGLGNATVVNGTTITADIPNTALLPPGVYTTLTVMLLDDVDNSPSDFAINLTLTP